jgi:dihydrofolate reductase
MKVFMIVACDQLANIGKNGKLPWNHIKEDMEIFKRLTTEGDKPAVIMGRKTWESIPDIHRPLPGRLNVVMSRTVKVIDNAMVATSQLEAIKIAKNAGVDRLWVIGGEQIYTDFMGIATEIIVTKIHKTFDGCDAVFPYEDVKDCYKLVSEKEYETKSYNFTVEKWIWS